MVQRGFHRRALVRFLYQGRLFQAPLPYAILVTTHNLNGGGFIPFSGQFERQPCSFCGLETQSPDHAGQHLAVSCDHLHAAPAIFKGGFKKRLPPLARPRLLSHIANTPHAKPSSPLRGTEHIPYIIRFSGVVAMAHWWPPRWRVAGTRSASGCTHLLGAS